MAEIIQDVILRVKTDANTQREAQEGVKGIGNEAEKASTQSNKLVSSFKGMLPALGVAAVVAGLVKIGKASLIAADAAAKSNQKLLVAANGRVQVQRELVQLAGELQKKTLFGDDATIEASAKLLPLLNGNADAVKKLLPLIQDFATFSGTDLVSAADLVGKSVGTQTNALGRYGIQVEGAVGSAERLESAMASLNKIAGGQAEAAAKVGLGGWEQFKEIMGDATEEIGFLLLKGLQPLFEILKFGASTLQTFLSQLRGATEATGTWGKVIEFIRKPIVAVIDYLQGLYVVLKTIGGILFDVGKSTGVFKIAVDVLSGSLDALLFVLDVVGTYLLGTLAVFNGLVKSIDNAVDSFDRLKESFKLFDFKDIKNSLLNVTKTFSEVGKDSADAFGEGFNEVMSKKSRDGFFDDPDNRIKRGLNKRGAQMVQDIVSGAEKEAEKDNLMAKVAQEMRDNLIESLNNLDYSDVDYLAALGLTKEQIQGYLDKQDKIALNVDFEIDDKDNEDAINDWFANNPEVPEVDVPVKAKLEYQEIVDGVQAIANSGLELLDSLGIEERVDKEIEALDLLIQKQQEVVDATLSIADGGNAEQLKLEEARLAALAKQQDEALKRKENAAKAEEAINKGLALSNSIVAITEAAKSGVGALALIPLIISAVAAGISTISSLASFYDGTEDTGNGGKLDSKGGFLSVLHPNEKVLNAKHNKRIKSAVGNVSNEELVKMIENGNLGVNAKGSLINFKAINDRMVIDKQDELIALNKRMLRALEKQGLNINIDENGFAMRTSKIIDKNKLLNQI